MKTFRKILLGVLAIVAFFIARSYFEWTDVGIALGYAIAATWYLAIKLGDLEKEVEYLKYRLDHQD